MAIYEIAANLDSSLFPFASEMWGRSIMFPQYDENYNRTIFSTVDPGFEKVVPQIYYMHNVMPTIKGYQAIGYDLVINGAITGGSGIGFGNFAFGKSGFGGNPPLNLFDRALPIQTAAQNNFLFSPAGGLNYIYDKSVGYWQSINPIPAGSLPSNIQVTTAFVQGQTYICYAGYGVYIYNETLKELTPVTLISLNMTQVLGITQANGYMIAYTNSAIAWSSLSNPLDFTPSIITGAGGGSVGDAKGPIIAVLQITGGFIIYCEQNAVGGTYTANSSFPFILLEIAGSGGINSIDDVSWHSNMPYHIVANNNGIQKLNKSVAEIIYPEALDFFASKLFEDYNETTGVFTSSYLNSQLTYNATIIEARYVIFSYGQSMGNYTHALLYDTILKRWGKARINHTFCFEWNDPNLYGPTSYGSLSNTTYGSLNTTTYGQINTQLPSNPLPKKTIAFLQSNGNVYLMNFDMSEAVADGVFMIGKFQFQRRHFIEHQYGIVETINNMNNFTYEIIPTLDGKTLLTPILGFVNPKYTGIKNIYYNKRVAGLNISILFKGAFNLVSFVIGFDIRGVK